ncbi:MAG TPA: hypothetical protein VJZ50_06325, partial [Candidatus Limnocylindrales bacterium]|nr:hypothetical protein [Candidatus Limnocylindrales bacterium]
MAAAPMGREQLPARQAGLCRDPVSGFRAAHAALELVRPDEGDGRVPDGALARHVLAAALERKLMLLTAGPYGNVVRIIPPLVT